MGCGQSRALPALWTRQTWSTGSSEAGPSTCGSADPLGRTTTIDVLVWRHDEVGVHNALTPAGWLHTPTPEDLVGTNYARGGYELQLTFVVPGAEGGVVVPVVNQPMVLSTGPLPFARREVAEVSARVLTLEMMLALKSTPRADDAGGAKDRADLVALRAVVDGS